MEELLVVVVESGQEAGLTVIPIKLMIHESIIDFRLVAFYKSTCVSQ